MRRIVLDTETTGLDSQKDRICEIVAIEIDENFNIKRKFHSYINPEVYMPHVAEGIHGLSDDFLSVKPKFEDIADTLLDFMQGATIIAHNVDFDMRFINAELDRIGYLGFDSWGCETMCTMELAKIKFPGQSSSLDALCDRFGIDRTIREKHGALRDAKLLIEVYKAMLNA